MPGNPIYQKWSSNFIENHQNWFRNKFNVPSCIIRFDYVINSDGIPCIFEVEDRPAGFEISAIATPDTFEMFVNSLQSYSEYAKKPIGVCVSEDVCLILMIMFGRKELKTLPILE